MSKKKNRPRSEPVQAVPGWQQNALFKWAAAHPNWAAFGIYMLFVLFFFRDVLFFGDIFISPDAKGHDAFTAPLYDILRTQGKHPLWSPFVFCGMPGYAGLTFTPFSYFPYVPFMLIEYLVELPGALRHVVHYPLAGLGVYLILRDQKCDFLPAFFGGFAFMFTTHLVSMEVFGHGSKLMSAVYMPLALWSIHRLFTRGRLLDLGLTALILGVQFQRAHVQIVYYTWLVLGTYLLFVLAQRVRSGDTKRAVWNAGRFIAVLALGLGMAAVLYLPVLEYTPYSIRGAASVFAEAGAEQGVGFEYATRWSFSPGEMMTFLLPSFYGFGGQTYWGTMPFTDYPHYMGVLVFLLGIYGLIVRRTILTVFLATCTILALLISFGKNLPFVYQLFYEFMPYFNKFRVPVMILIIVQMSWAVLAGIGLQVLGEKLRAARATIFPKALHGAIGVFGFALLFTLAQSMVSGLMRGLYPTRYDPGTQAQIDAVRFEMLMTDVWIAALVAGGALILLYLVQQQKLKVGTFLAAITIFTVGDLWLVNAKIMRTVPASEMQTYLEADATTRFLNQDKGTFRIFPVSVPFIGLNLTQDNRWAAQGIQSIGGYHAAKPRVYQDLLDATRLPETYFAKYYQLGQRNGQTSLEAVAEGAIDPGQRAAHQNLLNFLNVKYLLCPYPIPEKSLELRHEGSMLFRQQQIPMRVYENKAVLPRAYFVGSYRLVNDPKAALVHIASPDFAPRDHVLLYEKPALEPAQDSTATAEITNYTPDALTVRTRSSTDQLLVLSDTHYPAGWKAWIDGTETTIYQANHAFRAIAVPAGSHEIEFRHVSEAFSIGLWLTILSTVAIAGCLVVGLRRPTGRSYKDPERKEP